MDPLGRCTDAELWDAIAHVQLANAVKAEPGGLDAKVRVCSVL